MLHQPPSSFSPPPSTSPEQRSDRVREAIRQHCARAGLSPTAVARAAGLAPSTLIRFLAGKTREMKDDNLIAIAAVLERAAPSPKAPAATDALASPGLAVLQHVDTIRADAEGHPIFDVPAYVSAMRGAGAVLRPIRGKPGSGALEDLLLDVVQGADHPAVMAVEAAFAERRAADPNSAGRVAQFLFTETSITAFRKRAGDDPAAMMRELVRLDTLSRDAGRVEADAMRACDEDESNPLLQKAMLLADETGDAYYPPMLDLAAKPIATAAQAGFKVALALTQFRDEVSREQLLAEVVAFLAPDLMEFLPRPPMRWPREDLDLPPLADEAAAAPAVLAGIPAAGANGFMSAERFAARVGGDLALALVELGRLRTVCNRVTALEQELRADGATPAVLAEAAQVGEAANAAWLGACEHVLALPIANAADAGRKAEFALRYCDFGSERQKVLDDIAVYFRPELAGAIAACEVVAA